jgi:pyruvate dehydrogenase E1 component
MFSDGSIHQLPDVDPQETKEWLESLDGVIDVKGKPRAHYLLARLMERAREGHDRLHQHHRSRAGAVVPW